MLRISAKHIFFFALFAVVAFFIVSSPAVFAQENQQSITCEEGKKACGGNCISSDSLCLNLQYPSFGGYDLNTDQELTKFIAWLYYFMIGIGGLLAFLMLTWGGVQYLSSAGNPGQIGDAKDKIQKAIFGLLLLLSSVLIIQLFNPDLTTIQDPGAKKLKLGTFELTKSTVDIPYRCSPISGANHTYQCAGGIPLAPGQPPVDFDSSDVIPATSSDPAHIWPEACVITSAPGEYSKSCVAECFRAGGESGKFVETWTCCNVPSPENPGPSTTCRGITKGENEVLVSLTPSSQNIQPLMQSVMQRVKGVYACDDVGCRIAWRKFTKSTPRICRSIVEDSSPSNDDLCTQIGSLYINQNAVVVLYEEENYNENYPISENKKRVCFDNTSGNNKLIANLDAIQIAPSFVKNNGWNEDADSIKILDPGDPEIEKVCQNKFEETLPSL
ncbi:MAG: hypothetical protein HYV77_02075 [Candidatus Wildermuthbacteria bacterium]|nr:hypothetical protein [Candidatus Wildermuthbacteria bacterium]